MFCVFVVRQLTGCFPCDVSVLDLHDALPWQPVDGSTCCLKSLDVYTDGAVICCRQAPSTCSYAWKLLGMLNDCLGNLWRSLEWG